MHYIKKFFAASKVRSVILLLLAALCAVSLASYNPGDPSFNVTTDHAPRNILLYFGSYISDFLYQLVGLSAFIISVCCIAWSYNLFRTSEVYMALLRTSAMIFSICFCSVALNAVEIKSLPANSGGVLGISLWHLSSFIKQFPINEYKLFINIGFAILSLCFLLFALGIKIRSVLAWCMDIVMAISRTIMMTGILQRLGKKMGSFDDGKAYYAEGEFGNITEQNNPENEKSINTPPLKKKYVSAASISKKPEINTSVLPSIDLLDDEDSQTVKPQTPGELNEKSEQLLAALQDFGVKGKIINVREGPVVTMYEFEPAAGTKSSRIIGLADDIARSLSAISARIAVIPGRNALGVELPNKKRMFFRLKELVKTKEFQNPNVLLPMILGKDLSGAPLIADLAKMPHLLVAGTTGSGKSVAINAMIMSLLYRYTPEECKMIMIDPKMLELSAYNDIPHLMTPVVTESGKAVVALKWAVKEMEDRYRLMSHLGVRNIANYNSKILEAAKNGEVLERKVQTGFDSETGKPILETLPIDMNKMPFIVVIVDEMADLMLVAGKDIETSIQRLAQMARAAGIHIIMATQRPSVDIITGVIKANFPSRISFKLISKIDSRTILGEQGSEQLLGLGDMLYMGNSARILRVHGPFVDDSEVERVTNFLRSTAAPQYISAVTESVEDELASSGGVNNVEEDDIYTQAVNIVRIERKASISYIQRCLRIGYNRAANLVEEMEKKGILSEPNHSGKREILLPED